MAGRRFWNGMMRAPCAAVESARPYWLAYSLLDWSRSKLIPVSSYSSVAVPDRSHNVRNSTPSLWTRTGEAHLSIYY